MLLPFITIEYITNLMGKKSFKDAEDPLFLINAASKKVKALINLEGVKYDVAENDGLESFQREAIKEATAEYALFFESTGYDFTSGSVSVNILSASFSESRQFDDSPVNRSVVNILTKAGLIVSQSAKYLNNQFDGSFSHPEGYYSFDAESLDVRALKRLLTKASEDSQLRNWFKGEKGDSGSDGLTGPAGRGPTPQEIEEATREWLERNRESLKGDSVSPEILDSKANKIDVFTKAETTKEIEALKILLNSKVSNEEIANAVANFVTNSEETCRIEYLKIPDNEIILEEIKASQRWKKDGWRYLTITITPDKLKSYIQQLKRENNSEKIILFANEVMGFVWPKGISTARAEFKAFNLRHLDYTGDINTDHAIRSKLYAWFAIDTGKWNATWDDYHTAIIRFIKNFDLKDYENVSAQKICKSVSVVNNITESKQLPEIKEALTSNERDILAITQDFVTFKEEDYQIFKVATQQKLNLLTEVTKQNDTFQEIPFAEVDSFNWNETFYVNTPAFLDDTKIPLNFVSFWHLTDSEIFSAGPLNLNYSHFYNYPAEYQTINLFKKDNSFLGSVTFMIIKMLENDGINWRVRPTLNVLPEHKSWFNSQLTRETTKFAGSSGYVKIAIKEGA